MKECGILNALLIKEVILKLILLEFGVAIGFLVLVGIVAWLASKDDS